jgi:GNAT superfamily N-acetyltransferase
MTYPITIKIFETEELDAVIRNAIIDVCVAAHEEEDFKNLFSYIPSGGLHVLAYQREKLVSHAVATTRWLQPEGHPLLKTAYIDAVSTLPSHQGQGYGSAVMRHLADALDSKYVIACLETEREGFYILLGWETWRGALAGRSEHGLVPTPEQKGIMILRLSQTPPLDLDSALTIECQDARIW